MLKRLIFVVTDGLVAELEVAPAEVGGMECMGFVGAFGIKNLEVVEVGGMWSY